MNQEDEQRKLQSLLAQIKEYQSTLQDLSRQAALNERALKEVIATISALDVLPKTKSSESLIPIGAGVYTRAEIKDKKNFIVSVGNGICMEKPAADAKSFLEERKAKLEKDGKNLREQAQKIGKELERANQSAEELYSKLQKGGGN